MAEENSTSSALDKYIQDVYEDLERRNQLENDRRESFYKILNLNDVITMPYDFESDTELEQKLDQLPMFIEENRQKTLQCFKDLEMEQAAILQDVEDMEKVYDKMSVSLFNKLRIGEDKLMEMGMEPTCDLNTIKSELDKVKRNIAELKEKLRGK